MTRLSYLIHMFKCNGLCDCTHSLDAHQRLYIGSKRSSCINCECNSFILMTNLKFIQLINDVKMVMEAKR